MKHHWQHQPQQVVYSSKDSCGSKYFSGVLLSVASTQPASCTNMDRGVSQKIRVCYPLLSIEQENVPRHSEGTAEPPASHLHRQHKRARPLSHQERQSPLVCLLKLQVQSRCFCGLYVNGAFTSLVLLSPILGSLRRLRWNRLSTFFNLCTPQPVAHLVDDTCMCGSCNATSHVANAPRFARTPLQPV